MSGPSFVKHSTSRPSAAPPGRPGRYAPDAPHVVRQRQTGSLVSQQCQQALTTSSRPRSILRRGGPRDCGD
eukprot:6138181-Pyramimonas_sp.AAC.1